jgi:hypothetical protein
MQEQNERPGPGEPVGHASQWVDARKPGARSPWWQDRRVAIGAAAAICVLVIACIWLAGSASVARERMAMLEARAAEGFLAPPSTIRTERVSLGSGGSVSMGGGTPERLEIRIDARSKKFNLFRIAVLRDDGTTVMRFDRLQRDSNGELRFALNSTLLPPARYTIRVEGFTWRGETVPVGVIGMTVMR